MVVQSSEVGPNLRISGAQTTLRAESDIRIDVGRPDRILGAANARGAQAQFFSLDGGQTWQRSTLPLLSDDDLQSDPTVGWTSDGTAWAITIGIADSTLRLRAYRSSDGGATWSIDGTASGSQTDADKEMMWVDRSSTSPFANTIYVIWHNGMPAFVNRRTGPAGAWQNPIRVSGAETTGTAIGGDITTNARGEVFAFWPDTGSKRLLIAKSTNGGASFGPPAVIASTFAAYDIGVPSFAVRRALVYLSGAAYSDSADRLVYAAWTDLTGAAGCSTSTDEPDVNVSSACKTRIWFARSLDGGTTWNRPTMLNNQAGRNDQFNPRLAVDATDGTVVVSYYDTIGDAGRIRTNLWYQSSPDSGTTWTPPVRVTTASTDETSAGADDFQYGDYNGLSGHAGIFFPCWTDRRNNAREEVWTARTLPDSVTDYILMTQI